MDLTYVFKFKLGICDMTPCSFCCFILAWHQMLIHSRYYIHINLWWWRYIKNYQLRLLLLISTRFGDLCKIPKTYLLFVVVMYQTSNKVFIFGRFGWQSVSEFMYILLYLRTDGDALGCKVYGVFYLILSHWYWWSMI